MLCRRVMHTCPACLTWPLFAPHLPTSPQLSPKIWRACLLPDGLAHVWGELGMLFTSQSSTIASMSAACVPTRTGGPWRRCRRCWVRDALVSKLTNIMYVEHGCRLCAEEEEDAGGLLAEDRDSLTSSTVPPSHFIHHTCDHVCCLCAGEEEDADELALLAEDWDARAPWRPWATQPNPLGALSV